MTYLPLPSPKGGGAIYFLDSLCRHIFFDCIDKREEKFMYICRAIYFLDDRYTARSFMPKSELTDSDISWAIFFLPSWKEKI